MDPIKTWVGVLWGQDTTPWLHPSLGDKGILNKMRGSYQPGDLPGKGCRPPDNSNLPSGWRASALPSFLEIKIDPRRVTLESGKPGVMPRLC